MRLCTRSVVVGVVVALPLTAPGSLRAQSLLDRTDHLSTNWAGQTGTLYFNFIHRFSQSPPPERKVSNFPTFLVATGFASKGLVGFHYASNSALAARYPNEWEFFARYSPLQQEADAPIDLGAQLDYNLAVKGIDGEISVARRQGPLRLAAVGRMIADTLDGDEMHFAFGGGGTLRFGRFLALAGDAVTLTKRLPTEKIAWSAGVHIALPNTPHSLSLHVSNATTSTLQGVTRGTSTRRWGFEFTVPVHLGRFFTTPQPTTPPVVADPTLRALEPTTPTRPDSVVTRANPVDTVATRPVRVDTVPAPVRRDSVVAAAPTRVDTTRQQQAPARAAAPTTQPPRQANPTPTQTPAPGPRVVNARMRGSAFLPARVEISAGTTVRWRNLDALIHTVTATDKSFDSGVIAAEGSYSRTFTRPGTYPIICLAHPFMKATVVVK